MKNKIILFLSLLTLFASCKPKDAATTGTTTVTKYVGCDKLSEGLGTCLRWMDRTVYFAYSTGAKPNRNNEFQKSKIKEALNEIQENTSLGRNYFTYQDADESLLNPILEAGLSQSAYKSFIVIWDDVDFNNFVVNTLGGNIPDVNAVTVINSAFKRKFYMIFRASCFSSAASCNSITSNGIKALVARQFGLLTGLSPVTLATASQDVMYPAVPSDIQWSDINKERWFSTENGLLEVIYNNPNYYDEYIPSTAN